MFYGLVGHIKGNGNLSKNPLKSLVLLDTTVGRKMYLGGGGGA